MTMHNLIVTTSKKGEEKKAIDRKEYLFEAQLNRRQGRPNYKTCKRLLKMCPEIRRRQSGR